MLRVALSLSVIVLSACSTRTAPSTVPEQAFEVREEPVTVQVGTRTIQGTWTQPATDTTQPAVLFISGSGPTDRDWNSPLIPGSNGSGALLATALAERGIASLRYDKYGLNGIDTPLSWGDYDREQRAVLDWMHAQPDIGPTFIVGHSEGGLHALHLADSGLDHVDGLVLLSTPGRPMNEVLVSQVSRAIDPASGEALATALERIDGGAEDVHVANPAVDGLLAMFQAPLTRPFLSELLFWDPRVAAGRIEVPMLLVIGGKDIQITAHEDTDRLEAAARTGMHDITRVDLPWSDHVFKLESRPTNELTAVVSTTYNSDERRLDPGLAEAIAGWIYR